MLEDPSSHPPPLPHTLVPKKKVPEYLKLEHDAPLAGTVKPYSRHVLFCEGEARRWPAQVGQVCV